MDLELQVASWSQIQSAFRSDDTRFRKLIGQHRVNSCLISLSKRTHGEHVNVNASFKHDFKIPLCSAANKFSLTENTDRNRVLPWPKLYLHR